MSKDGVFLLLLPLQRFSFFFNGSRQHTPVDPHKLCIFGICWTSISTWAYSIIDGISLENVKLGQNRYVS